MKIKQISIGFNVGIASFEVALETGDSKPNKVIARAKNLDDATEKALNVAEFKSLPVKNYTNKRVTSPELLGRIKRANRRKRLKHGRG